LNIRGSGGAVGGLTPAACAQLTINGSGGSSFLGGGGSGSTNTVSSYGGGSGGTSAINSAAGGAGVVIVEY
jgi:hypothetical protein